MVIYIVDDDVSVREVTRAILEAAGYKVEAFDSAKPFLDSFHDGMHGCLLLDQQMPDMTGSELQQSLVGLGCRMPIIFFTGYGDINMAVTTMQMGACDFITKPYNEAELIEKIERALNFERERLADLEENQEILNMINSLTAREKEVFENIVEGKTSKVISFDLGISERTVDVHRSNILKKFQAANIASLIHKVKPYI